MGNVPFATFLKTCTRFKSVKVACGEGGCGACTVAVVEEGQEGAAPHLRTINSCLAPAYALRGRSVLTAEGLPPADGGGGHSLVAERLTEFHASQCGYCTPGFTVACHAAAANAAAAATAAGAGGAGCPGGLLSGGGGGCDEALRQALDGNLCRCTGYRPIVAACRVPELHRLEVVPDAGANGSPANANGAVHGNSASLVNGNGHAGSDEPAALHIGAAVTLEQLAARLDGLAAAEAGADAADASGLKAAKAAKAGGVRQWAAETSSHLRRIAGRHVRNSATVGGNLVLAAERGLPSDVATLLGAAANRATRESEARGRPVQEGQAAGRTGQAKSAGLHHIKCLLLICLPQKHAVPKLAGSEDYGWQELVAAVQGGMGPTAPLSAFAWAGQADLPETDAADAPGPLDAEYMVFGVAAALVEVDVLTGERRVLRADIFFDLGRPVNPACPARPPAPRVEVGMARCNLPPRTAVRGPGEIQGIMIIEQILEHVAAQLGVEPEELRAANFTADPRDDQPEADTEAANGEGAAPAEEKLPATVCFPLGKKIPARLYTVPLLWRRLRQEVGWTQLKAEVDAFNAANPWVKRGLAMLPAKPL
ncbi:Indole-3-acetaldehyde oxidase [Tetrabaena socialis]|uniref:Indole-3-acetaldehyde oxidase n=1 Tax=Tetrabaena socialis TaxID=47790 RepID=A0A2J7ZZQ5_9CHLO|nr:Indole-3-acetaldehyde oxidase [Tetrabaena socialis]|eukprot:PNH05754.1 Indole-3-acetaldehyde oxidase [Tetrabaena socialis]